MAIINLFGASGHAKVIIDIIKAQGGSIGCLYDDAPRFKQLCGFPVIKGEPSAIPMIISIGNNTWRKNIASRHHATFATAIHPKAIISDTAIIEEGSVIMQGAIIQADAHIGRHCIINTAATVDHECLIHDFVHIAPGATLCGNVNIGEGTLIGAGSTIIPGIKIGKWCTIGAGSVVINDIPDGATAYGNPCKLK